MGAIENGKVIKRLDYVPASMPFHAVAELLPAMQTDEFAALKADIKANGIKVPAVVWNGHVVDGRNRVKACRELRMPCPAVVIEAEESYLYTTVVSLNFARRHLSKSQQAAICVRVLDRVTSASKQTLVSLCGASGNMIARARRVAKADAAILKRVIDGELSLNEADDMLKVAAAVQDAPAEDDPFATESEEQEAVAQDDPDSEVEDPSDLETDPPFAHNVDVEDRPPMDELGNELPERLVPAFAARAETDLILKTLNIAEKAIKSVCAKDGGEVLATQVHTIIKADLSNIKMAIRKGRPHALCAACRGEGCKTCRKLGWISLQQFEQLPSDDRESLGAA